MKTNIEKVIKIIKNRVKAGKHEFEYTSPNYVEDTAYNAGIKLTSAEIVFISDNIEKL